MTNLSQTEKQISQKNSGLDKKGNPSKLESREEFEVNIKDVLITFFKKHGFEKVTDALDEVYHFFICSTNDAEELRNAGYVYRQLQQYIKYGQNPERGLFYIDIRPGQPLNWAFAEDAATLGKILSKAIGHIDTIEQYDYLNIMIELKKILQFPEESIKA